MTVRKRVQTPSPKQSGTGSLALKLTQPQRASLVGCTRLRAAIKRQIAQAAGGTQVIAFTHRELEELQEELGTAAAFAPGPDKKRLVAIRSKIINLLEDAAEEPSKIRPRPAKKSNILFQFKITLLGIKPPIWRRIQVRDCTLGGFHDLIQSVMGWEDCHLHQFLIDGVNYGPPADDDWDDEETEDENKVRLSQIVGDGHGKVRFRYEYDFGDGWEHEIVFEGFREPGPKAAFAVCLEGGRACPPEDVGGQWGYAHLLEAIANPHKKEHEELLEWLGDDFDPEKFSVEDVNKELRRWK